MKDDEVILNFGGIDIPESESQSHFAFVGTTGSGKSIGMRMLMQNVLSLVGLGRGYRALIYDAKEDAMSILSAFCNVVLMCLSPFDSRGVAWDIAADVKELRVAMEIAFTLIPESSESQPYFVNAARHILLGVIASFMLSKLQWTLGDLLRAVANARICRRVLEKHSETSGIVDKYFQDERLLNDVMSTLASKTMLYEPIAGCWDAAKERISLTSWANKEQILILGNSEISRFAINNINRCIFKRASDITLGQPEGTDSRTWFFIDEVSEAGQLTALPSLCKKGRSKGARVAIAFQSISGLRDPKMYGQHVTDDMLGQIGNRFFGRIECPETAEFASRVIGDQEVIQVSKSSSSSFKGSSSTTNWSPVVRRAALPSEFMSVPPCDTTNGLTGLFTTRSDLPTWDNIQPDLLFNELLIPPADDVPDFIPRDSYSQFLQPWNAEEEELFAPEISLEKRNQKRRDHRLNSPAQNSELDDIDF